MYWILLNFSDVNKKTENLPVVKIKKEKKGVILEESHSGSNHIKVAAAL